MSSSYEINISIPPSILELKNDPYFYDTTYQNDFFQN